jgi:hypothetical protein
MNNPEESQHKHEKKKQAKNKVMSKREGTKEGQAVIRRSHSKRGRNRRHGKAFFWFYGDRELCHLFMNLLFSYVWGKAGICDSVLQNSGNKAIVTVPL